MNFTKKQMALAVGLAFTAAACQPAFAGSKYWVCGNNTWDNGTCWSTTPSGAGGAGQPLNGDYVSLSYSDTTNRTVSYANAAYPSAVLSNLVIDNSGSGSTTLSLTKDSLNTTGETIGSWGRGAVNQSGGAHTVTGTLVLGQTAYYGQYGWIIGHGAYNLSGGTLSVGTEYIGQDGDGYFNQSGGTHTVDTLRLGYGQWGSTYNLAGGTLNVNNIQYGSYGHNFIFTAGTLNVSSSNTLGYSGLLRSNLSLNSGMNLNLTNNSSLTISDLNLNITGGNLNASSIYANGYGKFSQTGGSITTSNEYIGNLSSSYVTQSSGTHTVTNTLQIGSGYNWGGFYLNGGTLTVGNIVRGTNSSAFYFNAGTLNITGAGGLNIGSGALGNNLSLGTGKTLNVTNVLTIDAGSSANVTGGVLSASNATNNGTLNSNSILGVGSGLSNVGTLGLSGGTVNGNINNTGTVAISNTVNHTGILTQTAGITTVSGALHTNVVFIQGGVLNGSGSIFGNVVNNGGTVAVGNSPGSMNINGDYGQTAESIFNVELGGLIGGSQYDMLNVTGTASLDGTLNVSLFDLGSGLFNPQQGNYFDILRAEHLNGTFSTLALAPLDASLKWSIAYLIDANGTTDVVRLSVVQAVPVPAAFWLLGSGLAGLMGFTRRKAASR